MSRYCFPFLLFLFCSITAKAQRNLPAFGQCDIADLRMKSCAWEPDAPAMKLFDVTETSFEVQSYGTRTKTERHVRIKIFREKGFDYTEIRIPYFSKKSIAKLKDLDAVVYNLDANGQVITRKLKKEDFIKASLIKKKLGQVSFTFPDLRPGSIVEYRYTRVEFDRWHPDSWLIQGEIPVAYTAYTYKSPVDLLLKQKLTGRDTVQSDIGLSRNDQVRVSTFFADSIPSFKAEPFMSSEKDNLQKMIFFLYPRRDFVFNVNNSKFMWSMAGSQLLRSTRFGEQITIDIPGTESLLDSARKIMDTTERIRFLYKKVQQHFTGKAEETYLPDGPVADAWKDADGNSAEINLLLLNFLKKADITAYPLLVSTHQNGEVKKDFPSFAQLNGVVTIAMRDSVHYYVMDPTQHFQQMDIPPLNILNREALLLRPGNIDWFWVTDDRPLLTNIQTVIADIDSTGLLDADANMQHYHYAKTMMLDSLQSEEEAEKAARNPLPPEIKIISSEHSVPETDEDPVYETVHFTYEPQQTDAFYFYNPNFFSVYRKNPFTDKTRHFAIDLGCNQEFQIALNVNLPDNLEPETIPKNIIFRTPDSGLYFSRTCQYTEKKLQISMRLMITRVQYDAEEYAGVRDFFSRLTGYLNEEFVLRRKKNP